MGDAIISRRGGTPIVQAIAPTINQVSQTETSVVYNVTNNDQQTATIRIRLDDVENIGETIEVLAGATSQNFTLNNLDNTEVYSVFATANVPTKIKSNITEKGLIPTQSPQPTITITEILDDRVFFTLTNNSTETRTITYDVNVTPPIAETIVLTTNQTTSTLFFDNLTPETSNTLFASAGNSIITGNNFTTLPPRVFTAATGGTVLEYNDGGKRFRSHTFTSNGNFVVSTVGDAGERNKLDYLIIAGGGFGAAAGGGAGGYRTTLGTSGRNSAPRAKVIANQQTYSIIVGAGATSFAGNMSSASSSLFVPGSPSSGLGISTSGGGAGGATQVATTAGFNGGSGGGSAQSGSGGRNGGSGTTDEGFQGGISFDAIPNPHTSAGGGGAGQAGFATNTPTILGKGGDGLSNTLRTGFGETRGGGGGGSNSQTSGPFAAGGLGGGGNAARGTDGAANGGIPGTANTGGGGGGTCSGGGRGNNRGGSGGSGIVIIRYEIATV